MRILIVHLSDIHFKSGSDSVLLRAEKIADAANSRNVNAGHVLLAVTGDIAFSGKRDQYIAAGSFLKTLASRLTGEVTIAVVPGNHDCDFGDNPDERDRFAKRVYETPSEARKRAIVAQGVAAQLEFFRFRDEIANGRLQNDIEHMYYEYCIASSGQRIVIRCFNTAWMSKLHEEPGRLVFPMPLRGSLSEGDFAISLFHQPYNWLIPSEVRPFQHLVESNSDFVLSGHEHEHERHILVRPEAILTTAYVEGAALQQSDDPNASEFNVILLDTDACQQQFHHFIWNGTHYAPTKTQDEWEALPLQLERTAGGLQLEPGFKEWLTDAGVPTLRKQDGVRRSFHDIFIPPQLIESLGDPTVKQKRRIVKSEDVWQALQPESVVLISAPAKSGRTALGKWLYLQYLGIKLAPVYIDAETENLRPRDGLPSALLAQARRQYGEAFLERYRQLRPHQRAIIIDNIDKCTLKTELLLQVLGDVTRFATRVVIIGEDTGGRVAELRPLLDVAGGNGASYDIQPLNHGLRERLAQRWFPADTDARSGAARTKTLERVSRTLDTIIGRNYVPAFPVYVIAVLQAIEAGETVDMKASTHGYFYDLLIRLALAEGGTTSDLSIRLAFLQHLAYEMFQANKRDLSETELERSFQRYQDKHEVGGLEYGALIRDLITRGMLLRQSDGVRFRYPYLYYYFVARHLSSHISRDSSKKDIARLTGRLSDSESADILLFIAHLTHDEFVIEELLKAADSFYPDKQPASLDAAFLRSVSGAGDVSLTYVEPESTEEARRKRADSMDEQVARNEEEFNEMAEDDAHSSWKVLSSALNTMKILGQVLKNFPGFLEGDVKLSLVNACYGLGLRSLTAAFEEMGIEKPELLRAIVAVMREANPSLPEARLESRAGNFILLVTILCSYGIVRGISTSVASPELEPTYRRAFRANENNATRLIDASLKLDIMKRFPIEFLTELADLFKDQFLAKTVLKLLVLDHFEQYDVDRADRQSVCSKLGIEYKQLRLRPAE